MWRSIFGDFATNPLTTLGGPTSLLGSVFLQEVKPGVYTLRYGQQPVDGNHVGTSELYDFVLAVPVKAETDPAPAKSADELNKKSAATTGSNHPAIFSLLPVDKADPTPALTHDSGKDYWIVTSLLPAGGEKSVPVRLVVVGRSE